MPGQSPARGIEEMVTREHLDRHCAGLRAEMTELRGELRPETHRLGTRLHVSLTATMTAFLAVAVTVLSLASCQECPQPPTAGGSPGGCRGRA